VTQWHITGRRSGKTHQLVQWALEDPSHIILVPHQEQVTFLLNEYGPGLDRKRVLVPTSNNLRGRSNKVGIDNLDLLLQRWLGPIDITRVTATGELYVPPTWEDK
jgi:hypothetical protein